MSARVTSEARTGPKNPYNVDAPSQPSVIFYLGLEGMGGLEMDTDEEENVEHLTLRCIVAHLIL